VFFERVGVSPKFFNYPIYPLPTAGGATATKATATAAKSTATAVSPTPPAQATAAAESTAAATKPAKANAIPIASSGPHAGRPEKPIDANTGDNEDNGDNNE
jgi:hypothetical protein